MRIAAFPRGFLSLLQAQNFGENPNEVSETIVPTVDIGAQYLAERLEVGAATGIAIANGFVQSTLEIPSGEIWKVYSVNASVSCGAGVTIGQYAFTARYNNIGFIASNPRACAANAVDWNLSGLPPMYLLSGTQLGIYSAAVVGAPSGTLQVFFSRLRQ